MDFPLANDCESIAELTKGSTSNDATTIIVKDKKVELKSEFFLNYKEINLSLFDVQGRLVKSITEYPTSTTITSETSFN